MEIYSLRFAELLEMSARNMKPRLTPNQIKSKIDKLMASKLADDEEFCETIEYLQGLAGDVEEVNERQLRMALQDRELQLNRQFLENFEKVCSFNSHIIK